jgi:hypothetical protein
MAMNFRVEPKQPKNIENKRRRSSVRNKLNQPSNTIVITPLLLSCRDTDAWTESTGGTQPSCKDIY